jgi:glyoxylase-like metal-dependent hydrolase (beta-lactamase superfamily II)
MSDVRVIEAEYQGQTHFVSAYLLVHEGRAAFVETATESAVPAFLAALQDAGCTVEDVDWVIPTHAHLDHAGGAAALMEKCPNATLVAHPKAAPHLIDPSKLVKSAAAVYGGMDRFRELYGDVRGIPAERVRVPEDGETIDWNGRPLTFLYTRGHANHHFVVVDPTTKGVFTGDSFGIAYPELQSEGIFAFPSCTPTDFDAQAARESLDRILATGCERIYLTHWGIREDPHEVAEHLRPEIDRYEAWVDEAEASDMDDDALDAHFDRLIRARFDELLAAKSFGDAPATRRKLETDIDLNGQGLAFAVKKRRFKKRRAAAEGG